MERALKIGLPTLLEWVFLVALWMAFVSQLNKTELYVGFVVGAIGTFANALVNKERFAQFSPKLEWLALIFLEPWYALDGTWATLKAVAKKLTGKNSGAQFKVAAYDAPGDDPKSAAKRALAITYMTIPPNFIIVGIDKQKGQVLIHQVEPTPVPLMAKKLGVRE